MLKSQRMGGRQTQDSEEKKVKSFKARRPKLLVEKFNQSDLGKYLLKIKMRLFSFLREMLDLDKEKYSEFRQFFRFSLFLLFAFLISFVFAFAFFMNAQKETLVPNVIDENVLVAMDALYKEGFNVKVESIHSASAPKYTVIDQRPHAGISVKEGRNVTLTVSMGKSIDAMPNFIGKDISKAQADVIDMFSRSGDIPNLTIKKVASNDFPKDQVIDQSPLPNSPINFDISIVFIVSSGEERSVFLVKDYIGKFYQDIIRDIENAGIHVKIAPVETSEKTQIGKIIEQDAPPGTKMPEGSDITFKVWVDSSAGKTSFLEEGDGYHFIESYYVPEIVQYNPKIDRNATRILPSKENYLYALVEFGIEDTLGKRYYYKAFVKRGQRLNLPYEMYGRGTIFITLDGQAAFSRKIL